MNEHGLAIGFTSVCPVSYQPGFNSGFLVRYLLETCKTVEEAIRTIYSLPIASSQKLTLADSGGNMAVVECSCRHVRIQKAEDGFVCAVNAFHHPDMVSENPPVGFDNWKAEERFHTLQRARSFPARQDVKAFTEDVLSGKYGFICQYDRSTGADTVWSVIYSPTEKQIWLAEGNPSTHPFQRTDSAK